MSVNLSSMSIELDLAVERDPVAIPFIFVNFGISLSTDFFCTLLNDSLIDFNISFAAMLLEFSITELLPGPLKMPPSFALLIGIAAELIDLSGATGDGANI